MIKVLNILLVMTFFVGCSSNEHGENHDEIKKVVITEIPKDIKVPLEMWEVLAKDPKAKPEEKKEGEGGESKGEKTDAYVFAQATVSLKEKNEEILSPAEVEISLPRGGGEVDLASFVTQKQGSFYVKLDFPEFEGATLKKVLFISNSKKRKIDEQIFGSGCNVFMDISETFFKEMQKDGLKVNTTRNRHTSVLAGTFILMAKKGTESYISQVTIFDSKNPELQCHSE